MKRSWLAGIGIGLILVLVTICIVLASGGDGQVLTCGARALTNTELGYYYWSEFFYFSEAYGDYLEGTVDFSAPLDGQAYDDSRSWQDFLLDETLSTVRDTLAMTQEAEAEGFTLPGEYDGTYQQVLVNFAAAATEGGYGSTEAYLQASYGHGATEESFRSYLHDVHLAAAYADLLLERCSPTDAECRSYFADHQAEYEQYYDAVADDETTWLEQAREELQTERYQNEILRIRSGYPCQVRYEAIHLTAPEGLYE